MINVKEKETRTRFIKITLSVVLTFMPLIVVCIESIVFGNGIHLRSFIPATINDEYGWYQQIEALVKYNKPFGYFGYNEYHALLGNLSSWPSLTLLPYVLIGKVIGWNNYSMVISNIIILFFIFVFVFRCDSQCFITPLGAFLYIL